LAGGSYATESILGGVPKKNWVYRYNLIVAKRLERVLVSRSRRLLIGSGTRLSERRIKDGMFFALFTAWNSRSGKEN